MYGNGVGCVPRQARTGCHETRQQLKYDLVAFKCGFEAPPTICGPQNLHLWVLWGQPQGAIGAETDLSNLTLSSALEGKVIFSVCFMRFPVPSYQQHVVIATRNWKPPLCVFCLPAICPRYHPANLLWYAHPYHRWVRTSYVGSPIDCTSGFAT